MGYLLKDRVTDGAEFVDALRRVAAGGSVLDPEVVRQLLARHPADELSPREREVLGMIAEGRTAPAIARDLHLSTATIKTHLKTLYEKLGVSDRAAAVASAMRRGLIE
ncbi:MAG TPA: response regulator transcription factor [Solirubrobacteraceae bacterium]|nr:response regulator transcription factor [Solirubrobacteraceae bacterium]